MTSLSTQASDPQASVWVSASAGTGKTKILIDRLLRLLLHGAEPSSIVCLTYTRAAAGEMQARLYAHLQHWSTCSDDARRSHLQDLEGHPPPDFLCQRAAHLFSRVLDSPLRIQTLHSFCQTLVGRYILEAGLTPPIDVLDEYHQKQLLEDAISYTMHTAQTQGAFDHIRTIMTLETFRNCVRDFLPHRFEWDLFRLQTHTPDPELIRHFFEHHVPRLPKAPPPLRERLQSLGHFWSAGSPQEVKKASTLLAYWQSDEDPCQDSLYQGLFLTKSYKILQWKPTKSLASHPHVMEYETIWKDEAERLKTLHHQKVRETIIQNSHALMVMLQNVMARYADLKAQHNVLDYDDIIMKADQLLASQNPFLLDQIAHSCHHILMDEAQDTSAAQWRVFQRLAQEITASGTTSHPRTLFVVGDEKQCIFRFQGADPTLFHDMQKTLGEWVQQHHQTWRTITLDTSYRSLTAIIQAVDETFAHARSTWPSIMSIPPLHVSRQDAQGAVHIWPLVTPPHDEASDTSMAYHTAREISRRVQAWFQDGRILLSKKRPLQPQDIMILVQKRHDIMEALAHTLSQHDLPHTGTDRFDLASCQAVQDLIMIARFALYPHDDMALACVLKGPWCQLSEDDLCTLCTAEFRTGSLWRTLQKTWSSDHPLMKRLMTWRYDAGWQPPFAFFNQRLIQEGGRHALVHRLGDPTHATLDMFLKQCRDFEQTSSPTLEHFLYAFLEGDHPSAKRDLSQASNAIRLMSVHGSKGLQSPIVIIADAQRGLEKASSFLPQEGIWAPGHDVHEPSITRFREREREGLQQDAWRLLYVAMTRAEDELYLAGWSSSEKPPSPTSWYAMGEILCKNGSIGTAQSHDLR